MKNNNNKSENSLRSFTTLAIVIASSLMLASCGGGDSTVNTTTDSLSADAPTASAQAAARGTVPAGWAGRMPIPSFTGTPNTSFRDYKISDRINGSVARYVEGEIVVKIKNKDNLQELINFAKNKKYSVVFIGNTGDLTVTLQTKEKNTTKIYSIVDDLSLAPYIESASLNYVFQNNSIKRPSDPVWLDLTGDKTWNLNSIKWGGALDAIASSKDMASISIGILDAGFAYSHEDLNYNHALQSYKLSDLEIHKLDHGTHVAGTISAAWNNSGISGLTFGNNIFTSIIGSLEDQWSSIGGYFYDSNVRVINESLGNVTCSRDYKYKPACDDYTSSVEVDIVKQANIFLENTAKEISKYESNGKLSPLFVHSAGNDGQSYWGQKDDASAATPTKKVTADYNGIYAGLISKATPITKEQIDAYNKVVENILIVGSFYDGKDGKRHVSSFSSTLDSSSKLTNHIIMAPGGNGVDRQIWSTVSSASNKYKYESGTSMAAPHVTGVAAMLFQLNPIFTAAEVKSIILSTSDNIDGAPWQEGDGFKFLNAEAAVKEAIRRKTTPDCSPQIDISRTSDFTIGSISSWGVPTCKINGQHVYLKLSNNNFYALIDNPNSTSKYSYSCKYMGSLWDCGGTTPYTTIVIDKNKDSKVDTYQDVAIVMGPQFGTESRYIGSSCQPWIPTTYVPVTKSPSIGYVQTTYMLAWVSNMYDGGGFSYSDCTSLNIGYEPTSASSQPHYFFETSTPLSKVNLKSSGVDSFRLVVGDDRIGALGFIVNVK